MSKFLHNMCQDKEWWNDPFKTGINTISFAKQICFHWWIVTAFKLQNNSTWTVNPCRAVDLANPLLSPLLWWLSSYEWHIIPPLCRISSMSQIGSPSDKNDKTVRHLVLLCFWWWVWLLAWYGLWTLSYYVYACFNGLRDFWQHPPFKHIR